MRLQGCSYEIGMVNRAHLGSPAVCVTGCCGKKNRPLGYNPLSIPSLCLDSARHSFIPTGMSPDSALLVFLFLIVGWTFSFVFVLYFRAPSLLCVSLTVLIASEFSILTNTHCRDCVGEEHRCAQCVSITPSGVNV